VARYPRPLPQAKKLEVPPTGRVFSSPLGEGFAREGGRKRVYPLADIAPNGAYVSPKRRHRLSALKYAQKIWGSIPKEFSNMRIRNTGRFNVSPAIFKKKANTLSRKEKVISFVVRFSLLIEKCGSKLRLGPSPIVNLRRACSLLRTVLPSDLSLGLWPSRWGRAHKHDMLIREKVPKVSKMDTVAEKLHEESDFITPKGTYCSPTHNSWVYHPEVAVGNPTRDNPEEKNYSPSCPHGWTSSLFTGDSDSYDHIRICQQYEVLLKEEGLLPPLGHLGGPNPPDSRGKANGGSTPHTASKKKRGKKNRKHPIPVSTPVEIRGKPLIGPLMANGLFYLKEPRTSFGCDFLSYEEYEDIITLQCDPRKRESFAAHMKSCDLCYKAWDNLDEIKKDIRN